MIRCLTLLRSGWFRFALAAGLSLGCASSAFAVKIADITRIGGERTNILTGLGLVYGLKGTGDGGGFTPAIAPLQRMLEKFADPVQIKELSDAANVAVVALTATVPASGAASGDHLDVYVTSIGAAASLYGGRLFVTPMEGPDGKYVFAIAEGPVTVDDPSVPTAGVVHGSAGGAVMEASIGGSAVVNGQFELILDDPSADWTTASTIAKIINDSESTDGEVLAVAQNSKTIIVTIPANERQYPDSFISRVQRLPLPMLPVEARVQIDRANSTIIITGDVEISPVVITHKGLSISTITPPPVPSPRNPQITTSDVVSIGSDPGAGGGGNLQDLVNAMELLKVPAEDRIEIIEELYKTGKLHAKLSTQ
jgi:flagellar P-ring protein FlgI